MQAQIVWFQKKGKSHRQSINYYPYSQSARKNNASTKSACKKCSTVIAIHCWPKWVLFFKLRLQKKNTSLCLHTNNKRKMLKKKRSPSSKCVSTYNFFFCHSCWETDGRAVGWWRDNWLILSIYLFIIFLNIYFNVPLKVWLLNLGFSKFFFNTFYNFNNDK